MSHEFQTLLENINQEWKVDTDLGEKTLSVKDWMKHLDNVLLSQSAHGVVPKFFTAPMGAQLELTYRCNQKCVTCYNRSGEREHVERIDKELSHEEWLHVAESIAKLRPKDCVISGGEPLILGEKLFEIMDIVSNNGDTKFIFITNGMALDSSVALKLSRYNHSWVQISIDGASRDTFRFVRGVDGWNKAINAAMLVRKYNMPLVIASTIVKQNLKELPAIVEQAYLLGAQRLAIGPAMRSGCAKESESEIILNDEELKEFNDLISKEKERYKYRMEIAVSSNVLYSLLSSSVSRTQAVLIRPNGDVKFDCLAPFVLGNVRKERIDDIWLNKGAQVWRNPKVISWLEQCIEKGDIGEVAPRPHVDPDIIL